MIDYLSKTNFKGKSKYHGVTNHFGGSLTSCYRPQRSCGKVMFLHLSVILFTGGGGPLSMGVSVQGVSVQGILSLGGSLSRGLFSGGSLSGGLCPGGSHSRGSLSRGSLLGGGHSPVGSLSGRAPNGNMWAVFILLECILVHVCAYLCMGCNGQEYTTE